MQVQRQPKVAEIKRDTGSRNLRTSRICELRKKMQPGGANQPGGLAVLRKKSPLEAVLVDLQCLDLRFESRSGNAQSGSGS